MLQHTDTELTERTETRRYTEMCWHCSGALRIKWVESDASRECHIYECVSCGLERRVAVRG